MVALNTAYLSSNRGIIKILQIVVGFIICSLLCGSWYGGQSSCWGEGRLGYCSGLNFVIVIINIVLFILNFIDLGMYKLERLYSVIATVLFLVASLMIVWYMIDHSKYPGVLIASAALIIGEFFLFLWDVKILQGEAPN